MRMIVGLAAALAFGVSALVSVSPASAQTCVTNLDTGVRTCAVRDNEGGATSVTTQSLSPVVVNGVVVGYVGIARDR